ncbi:MAG: tyrosine recombinase XerC [Oxalobacteraceae bacterium]
MPGAQDTALVENYLRHLQTQRKLSAHTLDNYQRDLRQLDEFAREYQRPSLNSLSTFDLRRVAAQLHARGMSPSSIARKLSAWRGFFSWMAIHHGLTVNPAESVKPPKRAKALPKALGVDDAVKLVSTKPSDDPTQADQTAQAPLQALCNLAMFELLYSSGLRVSELTSLDIHYSQSREHSSSAWIDLDAAELTVTGKGGKRRTVPIGTAALAAVRAWLPQREKLLGSAKSPEAQALFVTSRGRRITPRAVQQRIKDHARAIGIPADVHPHMLRHSFASHLLQSSGDLRAVQEMLGHASIASTQVYTSLDFQRLAQVYDAAHPRARRRHSGD